MDRAGSGALRPANPLSGGSGERSEDFYRRVKTIALAPVAIPAQMENPEPVQTTFEALIAAQLQEAGFSTVPSREFAELWKRLTDQVGGIFDRITSQRDEAKFATVREHTLSVGGSCEATIPSRRCSGIVWHRVSCYAVVHRRGRPTPHQGAASLAEYSA